MENTSENKAKFLLNYQFKKLIFNGVHNTLWYLVPCTVSGYKVNLGNLGLVAIKNVPPLELKSLSDITDEDAITMAHYLKWEGIKDPLEARALIIGLFIMPANDHRKSQMFFDLSDISSAVDKLRELGYAYKYNEVSVEQQIEYNWVKLK